MNSAQRRPGHDFEPLAVKVRSCHVLSPTVGKRLAGVAVEAAGEAAAGRRRFFGGSNRPFPESVSSAVGGLAQLAAPVVPGGPSSTVGTYSNSWSPPSKVRLSTRSSLMSGYPS